MAILAAVDAAADVQPPSGGAVLQDELVEVGILAGVVHQQTGGLLVGDVGKGAMAQWDGDVGSLATQVLRGFDTAHQGIEHGAAVAAGYLDGQAQLPSDGFKTVHTQVGERRDMALQWHVGDVVFLGCS